MIQPEYWLRGKIENIPDILQPVAHSLMQSKEELRSYMKDFPDEILWEKPAERASVGFHLQHLFGVLDRLLTYAKNEKLSEEQFLYFKNEGIANSSIISENLVKNFEDKVMEAIALLEKVLPSTLTEFRGVGRKQMPSTVIGILFHAAEHTQRHIGQLLVTVSVVKASS
ncbi:DinB family protein [Gillisia marina]|uniref:DinB family protein n=1 Tax=Gillisia marina TaxID=1167637 RepID=UPI00029A07AA|nr:DinB family protein [Gillisia marina]